MLQIAQGLKKMKQQNGGDDLVKYFFVIGHALLSGPENAVDLCPNNVWQQIRIFGLSKALACIRGKLSLVATRVYNGPLALGTLTFPLADETSWVVEKSRAKLGKMLFSLLALGLVSAVLSAPSTTVQPESLADDSYPVPVSYFSSFRKRIGISEAF